MVQVTIALYHLLGVMLKREQFLNVTTVGYSAVIFGWVILSDVSIILCSTCPGYDQCANDVPRVSTALPVRDIGQI